MSEDELMSFIDVAKAANIPLSTAYYLHAKGEGPETVKIGRHLRVSRKDFDSWVARNKRTKNP
jgi:predicted DNA-binding transcriptional regulator AlpA